MYPRVRAELARNRGLITRTAALACGLSPEDLQRLVRSGEWVRVRRGVYCLAKDWEGLDEYVGRPVRRARAALMTMEVSAVLSHDSAARELAMPILRTRPELVHVTRPSNVVGSRTRHGVKHHGARFRRDQVVEVEGITMLNPARTAVDIGREHGYRHGLVACDSALRLGTTRAELRAAVAPMRCWPGVRAARSAVEDADAGSESVGETLARELVDGLGLGPVETQFELRDDTGWARCDLRVGRHVFEFDGLVKYQPAAAGGFAVDDPGDVVWREKQRERWVCGFGLGMSRIVWADFWGRERDVACERLRREYAESERRFGTSVDDLRHVIVARGTSAFSA